MSYVTIDDHRMHYRIDGPADAPVLMLAHSLGADLTMWDLQAAALSERFRIVRYDGRGHGASSDTHVLTTIERLARDALGLLDALSLPQVHFCGLSLGGQVGQWLGANAPARLHKLVLANTAARIGTHESWAARIEAVRCGGLSAVAPAILNRWFTPGFHARQPETVAALGRVLLTTPSDGYVACCGAIRDADFRETVQTIAAPTLVIAGSHDAATPPADGRWLAGAIPRAWYHEFDTAHLSNVEAAEQFTAVVAEFLAH
jgi:3-oxoadipate enol-lactonase